MKPLLHESLTRTIRQTAFEVHRYFGAGFVEKVYENALVHRLRRAGIDVQQQFHVKVHDEDGTEVGYFTADILVPEILVAEVKAVKAILPEHEAQVLNLLRASHLPIGLLINFGSTRLGFRRFIWTPHVPTTASSTDPPLTP